MKTLDNHKTKLKFIFELLIIALVGLAISSSLCYTYSKVMDRHYQKGGRKEFLVTHSCNNPHSWGTAVNNAKYLQRKYNAGAHFVIDDVDVIQTADVNWSVPAVGGKPWKGFTPKPYLDGKIKNANSISFEMCLGWDRNNEKIIDITAASQGYWMANLGLDPSRLVRHYDAVGKPCPFFGQIYMTPKEWAEFYRNPDGSRYFNKVAEDIIFEDFRKRATWYYYSNLNRLKRIPDSIFREKVESLGNCSDGILKEWVFPPYPIRGEFRLPIETKQI